jgi:FAD dependent oxidoreductase/EF hand
MKLLVWSALLPFALVAGTVKEVDVCVYGATPSGIMAASAVKRAGRTVVIVEPSRWVGGILGAGIKPLEDCPNPAATGGMTKPLLTTLGNSPEIIRASFEKLLADQGIEVVRELRVGSVEKSGGKIVSASFDYAPFDALGCPPAVATEIGRLRVKAKVFIDAGYEGDLMSLAGVPYHVARESTQEYGEEAAGVREPVELTLLDPYVKAGDAASGLLPGITGRFAEAVGSADPRIQAYNYRYYVTSDPARRAPLTPPAGYDAKDFELVGRYVEFLKASITDPKELKKRLARIFPGWMNAGEYNYHRNSLITMAPVGISYLYADGDYVAKAKVWKAHQDYLRGLHHFMSTDARVPETFRKEASEIGLDLPRHPDTAGWPGQLYVRLTRRLQGRYVITAADVYNRTKVDDPVALAQYGIDTYPSRRVVVEKDGQTFVGLEGWMFVGGAHGPTKTPYPIPYRALTPQEADAPNLLVSVCFSASFLGYASARMEPTFMMCGEAAGIAASQAIEAGVAVQRIDPAVYRKALLASGMLIAWDESLRIPTKTDTRSVAQAFMKEADDDHDGKISRQEWEAHKPGWDWLFPKIDKDGNGFLDFSEYDSFQRYKEEHQDWRELLKR